MAAGRAPVVGVVGMSALRRDFARMTSNTGPLYKAMRQAGREAAEPVAAETRSRLPQSNRATVTPGRLANDVRVTATKTGAGVRMGRASIRYAGWVEFGGTRRVPHVSSRQYYSNGRYLFPAARRLAGTSKGLYETSISHMLSGFRWTNEGNTAHD
jgi:hypothetical protein